MHQHLNLIKTIYILSANSQHIDNSKKNTISSNYKDYIYRVLNNINKLITKI